MNAFSRLFLLRFFGLLLLLGTAATVRAESATHPDVRVLIDISGSMKQNDPHNLRRPALELLVHLFPKDAKAGVWLFGESVEALIPSQNVSEPWRAEARKKAAQITSNSLYTNIPAALDRATADLDHRDKNYRTSIILLTDGMVDISKSDAENAKARQRILDEILPRLRKANVVVHTVALSKMADRELMERMAVDTGGLFAVAETADELNRIFLQAFDAAAPSEQVPLAGNHFLVDSSIDELTALVLNKGGKPVELVSPDNKRHSFASHSDDIKWFQGQGYDLVTVKKPYEGEWTVVADVEKGSRVTIVSNLSLAANRFSESLFVGGAANEAVAALKQQNEVIKQSEFLKLVKFTATVQRREDNKQWQVDLSEANPTPADGYFHGALPMLSEAGSYDVAINADGKTFQRSQRQTVAVRENFDVRVAATDTIPPGHKLTLFAQNPTIDAAATTVKAQIKTADDKAYEQAVAASGEREWLLALDAAKSGRVEVSFVVAGQYQNGEKFNYHSRTVAVDEKGGEVLAAAEPVAEEKKAEDKPEAKPEEKPAEPAVAEPAPAAPKVEKKAWKKWALYGGVAAGNLLILGLGFFAYRMIMGAGKSKVLEESDEDDEDEDKKAGGKDSKKSTEKEKEKKDEGKGGKRGSKGSLDLPDDAIDIEPSGDGKKKK